jgi:putative ABC transport system ATP-binding protein
VRLVRDFGDREGDAHRSGDGVHAMSEPVLEAVDAVKFLGEGAAQVQALKGVSLSLSGGELTLLMGPSGSGKTTLLSILGCMLTPTSGTVRIRGRVTNGAKPEQLAALRRDHIGFIFQSYHLFPTLTALDNVRLALDVRGENSRKSLTDARDALVRVGLGHKTGSYPRELSGGEQQRVAIARAIVANASAILADEPTAALDSENGQAIMSLLAQIAKDPGRGVLVVTHDPRIVPFADRIVRIEDGRIVGEERRGANLTIAAEPKRRKKARLS